MENKIKGLSRESILSKYNNLVKAIAIKTIVRLPASIQIEDLIQVGLVALLEAAKNYDPDKGASFETYAGIRIKGAMIDEVRREDWLPRSSHRNAKLLSDMNDYIAHNRDKHVSADDICKYLNINNDEYEKLISHKNNYKVYYFDDIGVDEENVMSNTLDKDVVSIVENSLLRKAINSNIEKLPEKEKLVLILYYENELSLKQIGEIMSLTESRVCQIHSHAMRSLEKNMDGWQ